MHTTRPMIRSPRRRPRGFTLVEVLIAFGIFAIGMIAVASMFPVAALLQRETVDDVLGKDAAESAKAIVLAKGLVYDQPPVVSELSPYYTSYSLTNNQAIPLFLVNPALANRFTIWDRSYPSFNPTIADRDLFWVPFIQDIQGDPNSPVWVMHLFILKRNSQATYNKATGTWANPTDGPTIPGVIQAGCTVAAASFDTFTMSAAHTIRVGDPILDNNGISYQVKQVVGNAVTIDGAILKSPNPPTSVWYAPPGTATDGRSPTLAIITFSSDPNDPDAVQLVSDPTPAP